jgi:hypothetical protein
MKNMKKWDAPAVALLILVVAAGWCTAQAKWTPEAWALPTRYLDPVYSDFIGASAYFKSVNDEGFLPFGWKPVSTLAAPGTGGWDRFPTPDEVLLGLFALLFRWWGVFVGTNIGVLLGHLMAAATFYLVARRGYGIATPWAFLGGLAFGLAPYQFAQQPHHVSCQYIWYLPLFLLVWRWIAAGQGLSVGSPRLWWAGWIGFVTGLQNTYYANIFCQLVLVCGGVRAWQQRAWSSLKPAALVIAAVATAFLLSNLDTITHRLAHPPEGGHGDAAPLVTQREYKWMDIYGFKLVDLFIPPVTHHSSEFAVFGRNHRAASVLNDEEGSGYLGLLGIGCLLFLTGVAVRALVDGRADDVPLEAWWVLWIIIMFTTGGLNAIIAAFTGFTLFRTAIRYSIVVLLLALLYAGGRLTAWQQRAVTRLGSGRVQAITLAATLASTALVLWDQLPRTPTAEQRAAIAEAVNSDRAFVAAMEAALPVAADGKKPMVFQLPVLGGAGRPTIPSSHHARPYLYSRNLHYSSGASGDTLRWQLEVERQLFRGSERDPQGGATVLSEANARRAIEMLQDKGFDAVYVNRAGYAGRAVGLEAMLSQLGFTASIESRQGDLVCVPLR